MSLIAATIVVLASLLAQPTALFTDNERAALVTYWSAAGRYSKSLPLDVVTKGVWQVRLTADGSAWLLKYQNVIGSRGAAPTVDPTTLASDRDKTAWKTWVQNKIAFDRRTAQDAADAANAALRLSPNNGDASSTQNNTGSGNDQTPSIARNANTAKPTPDPGPIPTSLLTSVGNPPPFASAVTPMQYTVAFDDSDTYVYVDNVQLPQAYAYYRFPQGVAVSGARPPVAETSAVFAAAGMTDSEQRIACAVSKLEGSFEAINTYDTGSVSVGFIQFITLDDGKHSLCEVLQQEKRDRPTEFAHDFHRRGIDVTAEGVIDVVDPATGAELTGPDAVHKLVDDKRLIAVFQRAGRRSTAFRIAQVQVAKSHYWPADDPLTVNTGNQILSGKVSDVIHSEAGIATLFDRKVNRGTCEPISAVVAKVMQAHGLSAVGEAAQYEREIIVAMKYRGDYLNDATLTQPQ